MCEVLDKAEKRGKEEGAFEMLVSLVKEGILALEDAAPKIGMSVEDFQKKMNAV